MRFELTILGCNSAIPANGRFPTAQVLNIQENLYLIDCGEGTQMRMNDFSIRRLRIKQIFISHLHGDHINGLIGLVTSFLLSGRTEKLEIFAPEGLEEIIKIQLMYGGAVVSYPIKFTTIDCEKNQLIFEDEIIEVYTIPLRHRIPTSGFLFKEKKRKPNMIPEKIEEYNIPYSKIREIKDGADFITEDGKVIANDILTMPSKPPRSYAYCSDTSYIESIIPVIKGVDLLYHETTYCHDRLDRAIITMHSTAKQAATIAKKAKVGQLITGHYSSRYKDLQPLLDEAKSVFENTVLGIEGMTYKAVQ